MSFERELAVAVAASAEAAAVIRGYFGQEGAVRYKTPDDPVTEADTRSNAILRAHIQRAFPADGWLSEESEDNPARLDLARVWVVDPLDGTREFVAGRPDFAVSVALSVAGRPVVGVIHNPVTDEVFTAVQGGGARLNEAPIAVSAAQALSSAALLVSRSELARGWLEPERARFSLRPMGGAAMKLARVAQGTAEATFSRRRRCEWDLAAGLLIVAEAGGQVTGLAGEPLLCNRPQPFYESGFLASNGALHTSLLSVLAAF